VLDGALSGSNVFLRVSTNLGWLIIGGQLTHTTTEANASIDVTCKHQGHNYRTLSDGEGLKTLDVSGQLIFSTDTAFDYIKAAFTNGSIERFQVVRNTIGEATDNVQEFHAKITAWNETAPDNDKTTADVTLNSSEAWEDGLSFEAFFASTDGQFITANNQDFYVRR
jgi:predicted secreted protein